MTDPLPAIRDALAGEPAWLVGGAVRDRLLGRPTRDFDVAVAGDPARAAGRVAQAAGGTSFHLSDAFGAWRVVAPDQRWHVDVVALRDGDIDVDLAARDFTINAMAEPLGGGDLLDPHGGRDDLAGRRVRMVSAAALAADPLRSLRACRLAVELDLELDEVTAGEVARHAPAIEGVAAERVFAELKRIVTAPRARRGLELMEAHGLSAAVLPELPALHGVEQNVFHHLDVHDHSLAVLDAVIALEEDPGPLGEHAAAVAELLGAPLADELTRGQAMRFAALLHDAAKPATRATRPDGRVTFIGHDSAGAELAAGVLRRLRASERLVDYVAALTRHHLRLGFLVNEGPLSRRSTWRYLAATEPHEIDVTVFTVADRLATRGRNAEPAIAAHLELAREMVGHALARRATGRPSPLVRGDELAAELGLAPGPRLGALLAALEEARFAGEVRTREDAVAHARKLLSRSPGT
jgi:poly(A) polymerase